MTLVRPGVYRLRVYVGNRPNGSPIQRSKTFKGGKRAAETALAQFVTDVQTHRLVKGEVTVGDLLDQWWAKGRRKPSTQRSYLSHIDHRIRPALGAIRLDRVTPKMLDDVYSTWLDEVSPTTVHQCHAILAAAFHQAVDWGWLDRSPTDRTRPPSPTRAQPRIPSPAELRAIINECAADPVLATGVALAALTGARRGELCALRWSDVDGDRLVIARSVTVIHGASRQTVEGSTKTHQERVVTLDTLGATVLATRFLEQRQTAAVAEIDLVADPYILSRDVAGGTPCKPDGLTNGFRRAARRLGLPYHLHQCRHFSATVALGAGVDVRTVGGRLGHADASMTLRVYARALASGDRAAAEAVGRALAPPAT